MKKWWKEKTFIFTIVGMAILGVVFTIGASIYSHEFVPDGLILFGCGILMVIVCSDLFKNRP